MNEKNEGQISSEKLLEIIGLKEVQIHAARETIRIYEEHIKKMNGKLADKSEELKRAYSLIEDLKNQIKMCEKKIVGEKKVVQK